MENDQPIKTLDEDKLERGRFVNGVVSHINHIPDKNCYIIGLYGKWGTGKTSLINLIDEKFKEKYFFTAYFNPWFYKSEESLILELFNKIIEGCQSDENLKSPNTKIGEALKKYAQYIILPKITISDVDVDFTKPVQGLANGIGEFLDKKESLTDNKQKINDILQNLAKPLIIFIDDIDRLDRQEIQYLFKMVKLTADFSNLRYILAFDEEMVAKSLSKSYGAGEMIDGQSFLEKIIQLPLRIPTLKEDTKFKYTTALIDQWIERNRIALSDELINEFAPNFRRLHYLLIKTPRDSKRLINAIEFTEICLKDEVNVLDIITLEIIRLFLPDLFSFIVNHKSLFTLISHNVISIDWLARDNSQTNQEYLKNTHNYPANFYKEIEDTIKYIFPYNNIFSNKQHNKDEVSKSIRNQRVSIFQYLVKYLEYTIDANTLSDVELKAIFLSIDNQPFEKLESEIQLLKSVSATEIIEKINYYLPEFTELGKVNIAKIIALNEEFHVKHDGPFSFRDKAKLIPLEFLIEVKNDQERVNAISFITKENLKRNKIHYSALLLYKCINGFRKSNGEQEDSLETRSEFEKISKEFIEKVSTMDAHLFFQDPEHEKCYILFWMWKEFGDEQLLRSKIQNFVQKDKLNFLAFMKSLIFMTHYDFSKEGKYGHDIKDSTFQEIESYIDRKELTEKTYKLYPDLKEEIPPIYDFDLLEIESEKSILIQYLRFVEKDKSQNLSKT